MKLGGKRRGPKWQVNYSLKRIQTPDPVIDILLYFMPITVFLFIVQFSWCLVWLTRQI